MPDKLKKAVRESTKVSFNKWTTIISTITIISFLTYASITIILFLLFLLIYYVYEYYNSYNIHSYNIHSLLLTIHINCTYFFLLNISEIFKYIFCKPYIWLSCDGANNVDKEHIGEIEYIPNPAFPVQYFPFTGQPGYLSPIVALKFKNLTRKYEASTSQTYLLLLFLQLLQEID